MISVLRSVLDSIANFGGGGAPKRPPRSRLLPTLAVLGNVVLTLWLAPHAHAQATGNTTIQPDCLIPFTFAAAGNFPTTPVANASNDNRTKGCAAWTLMYQSTGLTGVTVTLQSGSSPTTTVSFGTFTGDIPTMPSGNANPIVSDTGGELSAINGTASISWVRVNVAATGSGTLTGVLYGFRNSSAAVNSGGGGGSLAPCGPTVGEVQLFASSSALGCSVNFVYTPPLGLSVGNPAVVTDGSELVTNGGFIGGTTGWTLDAEVTYGTNNVTCMFVSDGCLISQATISTASGNWYRLQFSVSAVTGNGLNAYFTNNSSPAVSSSLSYVAGDWDIVFQANYTGNDTIQFGDNGFVVGDAWTLTNISLKQVSPVSSPLTLTGPERLVDLFIDGNLVNMGVGTGALASNTTGNYNWADGPYALNQNTTGVQNSACGAFALQDNTTGGLNTACGMQALQYNVSGVSNAAFGFQALINNINGSANTAIGDEIFYNNLTGGGLVGIGHMAGKYELGSDAFYVDNQDRSNTAGDKAGALLYGTFNATPSSQTLKSNATFQAGFGYLSADGTLGTTGNGFKNGLCTTASGACIPSGVALTASPLSQFASTTSAQLRGIISDETGGGLAFFAGGNFGAATGTSVVLTGNSTSLHVASNSGAPTVAAGGAIGTTPTIVAGSTDFFGTISIPSTAITTGTIATVTFATTYASGPKCYVTQNGGLVSIGVGHGTPGTGSFTITAAIANVSAAAYLFDYACSGA